MVKYTIENNKYEGERINYSTCNAPKLTSTTLNTNVVTWDRVSTKTRYTTYVDTIPGTTSTTVVNSTRTYKCEIYSLTATTTISKGGYMSLSVSRKSEPSTEYNNDHRNMVYTDSYTALVSGDIPKTGMASISIMNGYLSTTTYNSGMTTSTFSSSTRYPGEFITRTLTIDVPLTATSLSRFFIGSSSMSLSITSYSTQSSTLKSTTYLVTVPNFTQTISKTSTVRYTQNYTQTVGDSGTFAFTTDKVGAAPKLRILFNNNAVNSTYISNTESLLLYLGTMSISATTKTTSEREV